MNGFAGLGLMMMVCASYAQIYKWVDMHGEVHFSDLPHTGAQTITFPEPQSRLFPSAAPAPSVTNANKSLHPVYRHIAIIQPHDGETVRNNKGFVAVMAHTTPALFSGDRLQLFYDGIAVGKPQKNYLFQLKGMYRGTHTLAVQVSDETGKALGCSIPLTLYVFRPRVGMVSTTKPH